ncbi:type II secretion system protein GspD [Methylobacterium brachiatum]
MRVPRGSFKPQRNATPIPAALRAVPLEIRFPQDATLRDLVSATTASAPNVQIAFRFTKDKSEDILKRKIPFVRYEGTLGNFLDSLRTAMGVVVFHENGLIYISDREQYSVVVPQNEDMLDSLTKELKDLGADDIVGSVRSGRIVYSASAATQRDVIAPYLDRYSRNMAVVTIQAALVSVSINDTSSTGFDWNQLKVAFDGRQSKLNALTSGTTAGTASTLATATTAATTSTGVANSTTGLASAVGGALGATGVGATSAATSTASGIGLTTVDPGRVMDLTKSGLVVSSTSLGRLGGAFGATSITGAIDFLSNFGNTKVDQNVQMKTLSGTEVKLRSGQQVPYVRGVQLSGAGYGNGYGGGYGAGLGSSLTDKVDTGLTMEVTPYYDADAEVVTMEVGVKLKEILAFVDLNAGNQIGSFTQPLTQDQELTNLVRIQAGRTVVIGGLQKDSESYTGVEPTALRNVTATRAAGSGVFGNRSQTVKRDALFIILRPAVTVFVPEDRVAGVRK